MRYTVASLDVIGNEIVGWEINDKRRLGTIDLDDEIADDDRLLLLTMSQAGYLSDDASDEMDIDDTGEELVIVIAETGRPVLELISD